MIARRKLVGLFVAKGAAFREELAGKIGSLGRGSGSSKLLISQANQYRQEFF